MNISKKDSIYILIVVIIVIFYSLKIDFCIANPAITLRPPIAFGEAKGKAVNYSTLHEAFSDTRVVNFVRFAIDVIYKKFGVSSETIETIKEILFSDANRDPEIIVEELRAYIKTRDLYSIYSEYENRQSPKGRVGIIEPFINGPVIGDIGCGSGSISYIIAETKNDVVQIIATDIQEYLKVKHPKIHFRKQKRGDEIPIDSGVLNSAITSYVLHHIDEITLDKLLDELNRILIEGGRLIVIEDSYSDILNARHTNEVLKEFLKLDEVAKKRVMCLNDWIGNEVLRMAHINLFFNYKSEAELKDLFAKHGFEVEHEEFLGIPSTSFHFSPRLVIILKKRTNNLSIPKRQEGIDANL